tara:strand:+ start:13658 stop:14548 length:891 start_codon:yes stop_codon:yes gene_type:complete
MDLYQQPDIRSKAIAHQRDNEVEQYNEQIELVRQQIITQAEQRKQRASTESQRSEAETSALGAFTLKGSVKDIKEFVKEGKTDSVAKQISANLKNIKGSAINEASLKAEELMSGKKIDPFQRTVGDIKEGGIYKPRQVGKIESVLEKTGVKDVVQKGADKVLAKKGVKYAAEVSSKAATHLGPLMNIGMGIYDGVEAVQGDNWEKMNKGEKWESALQMGAGVSDALGVVFPPLFVLGAALGAASSIAGVVGEEEKEEAQVKQGGTIDVETEEKLEPLKDIQTPDFKATEITSKGVG